MRHSKRSCLAIATAVLSVAVFGSVVNAAEATASADAAWAPDFYGFCMNTHDAKKRTIPEQVQMLGELGFDGAGYPLWLDDELDRNLKTLDDAGLKIHLLYANVNVDPKAPAYDPRLPVAIRKLKGRPVTVCVLLRGFPPGDARGEEQGIKALRELGDVAAEAGLRISIYHHVSDWTESLLYTLQVVQKVDHPQVGANFNLCHWLKVDGDKDCRPVLRDNAAKVFVVTICGAQVGSNAWTDGLIQPLDRGDFDNRQLLGTLREIGYRGPIGLMCYGIPGDAREHLERSMSVWKTWEAEWAKK
jgi:sugar phosphate isomerase/epimerase